MILLPLSLWTSAANLENLENFLLRTAAVEGARFLSERIFSFISSLEGSMSLNIAQEGEGGCKVDDDCAAGLSCTQGFLPPFSCCPLLVDIRFLDLFALIFTVASLSLGRRPLLLLCCVW